MPTGFCDTPFSFYVRWLDQFPVSWLLRSFALHLRLRLRWLHVVGLYGFEGPHSPHCGSVWTLYVVPFNYAALPAIHVVYFTFGSYAHLVYLQWFVTPGLFPSVALGCWFVFYLVLTLDYYGRTLLLLWLFYLVYLRLTGPIMLVVIYVRYLRFLVCVYAHLQHFITTCSFNISSFGYTVWIVQLYYIHTDLSDLCHCICWHFFPVASHSSLYILPMPRILFWLLRVPTCLGSWFTIVTHTHCYAFTHRFFGYTCCIWLHTFTQLITSQLDSHGSFVLYITLVGPHGLRLHYGYLL